MVAFRSAVFLWVAASLAASPVCIYAAWIDEDVLTLMESVNMNSPSFRGEDSLRVLQSSGSPTPAPSASTAPTPAPVPSAAATPVPSTSTTSGSSKAVPASAAFATVAAVAAVLAGAALA